mgnify:CR=1 FL=1
MTDLRNPDGRRRPKKEFSDNRSRSASIRSDRRSADLRSRVRSTQRWLQAGGIIALLLAVIGVVSWLLSQKPPVPLYVALLQPASKADSLAPASLQSKTAEVLGPAQNKTSRYQVEIHTAME